ncbi:MAG: glycosyltransferase [Candidatus Shapirobacteria bacterium]|nr:glycosyltransferase [Candidatus Shapirobacteria bacterium]
MPISIVIPCYNEENNLKRGVLNEINDFLKTQTFTWEVLICNDESTDNSLKMAQIFSKTHPGFRIINLRHGGKPSAVWGGIQQAKYPLVLFTDMDQSTPLKEIQKLLPFSSQYDIIIGSRGIHREGYSLLRKIGGPVFLSLRRLVFLPNIIDTQCGFKMFKTDIAKKLFPHLQFFRDTSDKKGWRVSAFDVELLFMAQKWGYKTKEVEVVWRNEDTSITKGDADTRYKKESIQMINEIKRVLINNFRGVYDQKSTS